jgi:hypothetical protein
VAFHPLHRHGAKFDVAHGAHQAGFSSDASAKVRHSPRRGAAARGLPGWGQRRTPQQLRRGAIHATGGSGPGAVEARSYERPGPVNPADTRPTLPGERYDRYGDLQATTAERGAPIGHSLSWGGRRYDPRPGTRSVCGLATFGRSKASTYTAWNESSRSITETVNEATIEPQLLSQSFSAHPSVLLRSGC